MFADDTKVWCRIKTENDGVSRITLQEDLDKLSPWSDTWQLKFNAKKCKVMHIGHSCRTDYYMTEGLSGKAKLECRKKLETWVLSLDHSEVSQSMQPISSNCKKSNWNGQTQLQTLGYRWLSDYIHIRPHPEYCIQAWSPHLVKYIDIQ